MELVQFVFQLVLYDCCKYEHDMEMNQSGEEKSEEHSEHEK